MKPIIVLDSTPLGLLFQKPGIKAADECRAWLKIHLANGIEVVVPEIVRYELRRELLRLNQGASVLAMDAFAQSSAGGVLKIDTPCMELAAALWANARRGGKPTAHHHALDIDVILCAQVLAAGFDPSDIVVATSNVSHLSLFVPAQPWETI